MKTRAAVLWGVHQKWTIEEIDLDPPRAHEVLVRWKATGLCHSDEHLVTGDMVRPEQLHPTGDVPPAFPVIGGHEGAGIVEEVGPAVVDLAPGDHVASSFLPACGRCRWCVKGHSNLCDFGAGTFIRGQISDGTDRHHCRGEGVAILAKLGTFAEHGVVHETSLIKVDSDLPLEAAALVSCGVATGWGSAVYHAEVEPGDVVVVVGVGGVGMNAVQGARMVGARAIIAVDPVEFKQRAALEFGATHTASSMADATATVRSLTNGQMADAVILTPSVLTGDLLGPALSLTGKGGTCVATAVAPVTQTEATINLFEFSMYQKELRGLIFGAGNPRFDVPNLLSLYRSGQLKLDELITRRYTLDEINEGYQDMRDGRNIRGVIIFD